jgi:hypothetical protein
VHKQGQPKTCNRVGKFNNKKFLLLFDKKALQIMKRSRIFLGATTALLAIAGIAAAKAHRTPITTVYFYTKVAATNPHKCVEFPRQTKCTVAGIQAICKFSAQSVYTLYTSKVDDITCGPVARYNSN